MVLTQMKSKALIVFLQVHTFVMQCRFNSQVEICCGAHFNTGLADVHIVNAKGALVSNLLKSKMTPCVLVELTDKGVCGGLCKSIKLEVRMKCAICDG